MKNYIPSIVALCLAMAVIPSCTDDLIDQTPMDELGTSANIFTVSANAGHVDLNLYSNQHVTLTVLDDVQWAELSVGAITGDGDFYIDYEANESFPRIAKILVQGDLMGRSDTITLRQRGEITPTVKFSNTAHVAQGTTSGEELISLNTNLAFSDIEVSVKYTGTGAEGWVKEVAYDDNGNLKVNFDANPTDEPRTAVLRLDYNNGWDETQREQLFITQRTKTGSLGREVSFEDIRDLGILDEMSTINDFLIITGYVVSDPTNGNAGRIARTGINAVDYTCTTRTIYLESLDGRYGFEILTETVADNILERYDKVQLLLKDATITKHVNPERYTIERVTSSMFVSVEHCTAADIPEKRMYYSSLQDNDIYTYVTLSDCEFAVQKGSLSPVNDGYTIAGNTSYLAEYPKLIVDRNGDHFYTMTNMTCIYRRDGRRLPYGSGDLKGVVVHEKFKPFNSNSGTTEEERGYIGRYQIRHQSYDDFGMAYDEEDSYCKKLCQYKFGYLAARDPEDQIIYWKPYEINQDEANGRMWHTNGNGYALAITWNYLGWTGIATGKYQPFVNHVGNDMVSGWGMTLRDGSTYQANIANTNSDGKGADGSANNAWTNAVWWDANDKPNAWMVEFSTEGINTDCITFELSTHGYSTTALNINPIHWRAAWSFSRDKDDDSWHDIGAYDVVQPYTWGNIKDYQLSGYKNVGFKLPLEVLGHDKVYIKLYPENKMSNGSAGYGTQEINDVKKTYNALEYFAIRYNK